MSKKFFLKNVLFFVCPLLIPLTLLGALAYSISENHVKEAITINNNNILKQIDQHVDLAFNEMQSLNLDYSTNSEIILTLKNLLRSNNFNYQQSSDLNFTTSYLTTQATARPYIHSIYIYYENDNKQFITSNKGMVRLNHFFDKDWYEHFNTNNTNHTIWVQNRSIKEYSFSSPEEVITLYRNIFWSNTIEPQGLITLNIHKSYFENILNNLNTYENQAILVLDSNNNLLFGNQNAELFKELQLENLKSSSNTEFQFTYKDTLYSANHLFSEAHGWKYISITQTKSLYKVPIMLKRLTFLFASLSFFIGVVIIFYLTKRNINHVSNIISIIKSGKRGDFALPQNISFKEDEYRYIIENIIKSFVEQNQLKNQLTEKKFELQTAELLALQSQMNPHFLSNTLATIYWKTFGLTGKANEATAMLENLSGILNYSLRIEGKTVRIKDEIYHTKNYLEIMKVRYKEKFYVIWDYEETIHDYCILKLLLQPIIENSIGHGLIPKKEKGLIKIKIRSKDHFIVLSITDNGVGMNKSTLADIQKNIIDSSNDPNHIGLSNTYRRLQLTYDSNSHFQILSKPGWGTTVKIKYPILPK
ncbi:sensor histidine kinase [Metabacillus arenae]|uniref:Histidine kinase n=1 Tax=Metabacillus arenae TaxID=2771434 RepID=A0A926NRA8_9BACI|nr:sensor histidine kinase [Metabacillus arenae]MBD1382476.1 histidine kinase [Metabacillus arenae]